MRHHAFNLDNLDPATVPDAPLGAFDDADWHDVPEGYYLLPVHDWTKFGDECCGEGTPPLDLLGFRVFVRQVPTLIKTGQRAGQTIGRDAFHVGRLVLARGVQERVIQRRTSDDDPTPVTVRYTPSERLKREVDGDQWSAGHVPMPEGDTSPRCRCHDCIAKGLHLDIFPGFRGWKPARDQANAYANEVAAALIHSIKNQSDAFRKLYGQLTGHCGKCGRFIHEPESKRLGLGPDCGNRR